MRGARRERDGFFLRAESYFTVGSEIERLEQEKPGLLDSYGGVSPHEQSHGESFLALANHRFRPMRFPGIDRRPADDDTYVACVERIVAGMVFRFRPARVCIVRVKRWFDHRWLRFSGKGLVPFPSDPGVALDDVFSDKLTFPPFAPTRIASEHHWSRRDDGDYEPIDDGFRVHRPERTHSAKNLHRRVADVTAAGLFVWFSSGDARDERGSVMVHSVCDGVALPWFVSLVRNDGRWDAGEVKGLGRKEVRELLDHPPGIS